MTTLNMHHTTSLWSQVNLYTQLSRSMTLCLNLPKLQPSYHVKTFQNSNNVWQCEMFISTNWTADVRNSVSVSHNVKFENVTPLRTIKTNSQTTKAMEENGRFRFLARLCEATFLRRGVRAYKAVLSEVWPLCSFISRKEYLRKNLVSVWQIEMWDYVKERKLFLDSLGYIGIIYPLRGFVSIKQEWNVI